MQSLTLAGLNALDLAEFVAAVGSVFEHSPWVAEYAHAKRPFRSVDDLHQAMMEIVRGASREAQIAFMRAHPDLAGREALSGTMTIDSSGEQGRLGFTALPRSELERITRLNEAYRQKFGFPCIIALRLHNARASVLAEHERRLGNDIETEIANCLAQVAFITRGRIEKLVGATR